MAKSGQSVKHYHADNGRFTDNRFVDNANRKSQRQISLPPLVGQRKEKRLNTDIGTHKSR